MRRLLIVAFVVLASSACGSKSPPAADAPASAPAATSAPAPTPAPAATTAPAATSAPATTTAPPADPPPAPKEANVTPLLKVGDDGLTWERFPAITPDGKTLVAVRLAGGEIQGARTTSLVFVDVASGKEEERLLEETPAGAGDDPTEAELAARATKVKEAVAAGNADIARHTWVAMNASDKTVDYEAPNLVVRGADKKALATEAHPDWAPAAPPRCADFPEDKQPEDCDCETSLTLEEPHEHGGLGVLVFERVYKAVGACSSLEQRSYAVVRVR